MVIACSPARTPEGFEPYGLVQVERGHSSTATAAPAYVPEEWRLARARFEFMVDEDWQKFDSRSGHVTRFNEPNRAPDMTTVELSRAEKDSLFDLLVASGFFATQGTVGGGSYQMVPAGAPIRIEASVDSLRHELTWDPTMPELVPQMRPRNPRPIAREEPGLWAFWDALERMLRSRSNYRNLKLIPTH